MAASVNGKGTRSSRGTEAHEANNEPRDLGGYNFENLPTDAHVEFVAEAVGVEDLFVLCAVFMHEPGDLHVIAAVFGDFEHPSLAEPLDGLHSFGCLFDTECGAGNRIEGETMLQFVLQIDQHVECGNLAHVVNGVVVEDFIVEPKIIEAHDQIGALQFREQIINRFFAVDSILATRGAVSDPNAHPHFADFVPTADFFRRFLRFEVEVHDILQARNSSQMHIVCVDQSGVVYNGRGWRDGGQHGRECRNEAGEEKEELLNLTHRKLTKKRRACSKVVQNRAAVETGPQLKANHPTITAFLMPISLSIRRMITRGFHTLGLPRW
jgi:hypothetical protein